MATISKTEAYALGKRYMKVITYASKHQRFEIKLPPFLQAPSGEEVVRGSTQKEVEAKLEAIIKQIENSSTTTEKLIYIKLNAHYSDSHYEGDEWIPAKTEVGERSVCDDGIYLRLQCGVCEKTATTVNGEVTYTKYESLYSKIPSSAKADGHYQRWWTDDEVVFLPWTQSTEDFITDLCNRLGLLIVKLAELTSSQKTIMAFMDSKQQLLPDPNRKGQES